MRLHLMAAATAVALASCATTRTVEVSDASIDGPMGAAEALQTVQKSPKSALYLQFARDNLAAADQLEA